MYTVVLSFLPYEAGKQRLDEEMPKIRHFHFINHYQRDDRSAVADFRRLGTFVPGLFCAESGPGGTGFLAHFGMTANLFGQEEFLG